MLFRFVSSVLLGAFFFASAVTTMAQGTGNPQKLGQCRRAVVQGSVRAGVGFQQEFARGLIVGLEPIRSGWALRVVAAQKARGARDYAEVATLPYQSVSPLLLSTDWSFRAQDALGWTPRRFRYAANDAVYAALSDGYDAVLRGDAQATRKAAILAEQQPEGSLEVLDSRLAPGLADQTRMAAAVSAHFPETPHSVDGTHPASPLGQIEEVRFRIRLDLPPGMIAAQGTQVQTAPCVVEPTGVAVHASERTSKQR